MAGTNRAGSAPGYVVLRRLADDPWKPDEAYAAVLRSEWRIALDY
jgi:hypothetical protein